MEIRFSQSDARKVFLACEKNVHPIRTTNHAFVWQGMNTRQFSRHFCLLYPQLSSLNASGVDSGCLKKTRIFRCRKVFFNFVSAECSYSKVRHQGPSCKYSPIISEFSSSIILKQRFYLLARSWQRRPSLPCGRGGLA